MKGIVILEPGSIITIVAYNHESQPFEFCGKISSITDEKIILSAVFNGALEDPNSPFIAVEPDMEHSTKTLLLLNQFFEYRKQGFDIKKCQELLEYDCSFLADFFNI